jgi:hypothetical protein
MQCLVVLVNTWQCLLVPFVFDDCLVVLANACLILFGSPYFTWYCLMGHGSPCQCLVSVGQCVLCPYLEIFDGAWGCFQVQLHKIFIVCY